MREPDFDDFGDEDDEPVPDAPPDGAVGFPRAVPFDDCVLTYSDGPSSEPYADGED